MMMIIIIKFAKFHVEAFSGLEFGLEPRNNFSFFEKKTSTVRGLKADC